MEFPELVEICREACSGWLAAYMAGEVSLPPDRFLDMLHVLAHDGADAATVVNPPARIRAALARRDRRSEALDGVRWQNAAPEQIEGLTDRRNVESEVITQLDWELAARDMKLPPDQSRLVAARLEGADLQASDAHSDLGWQKERLEAARRSLEPDRRWGKRLQKRFSAYASSRRSPKHS